MKLLLLPAIAWLITGCAGYKIGPVQPSYMEGIRSIAVPSFRNETLEPRLEVLVAGTVIKQIQQDGTYSVTSADRADAILEGKIIRITRRPSRSVRGNVLATSEFELNVFLEYKVLRRDTGELLDRRAVKGMTSFFVTGGDVQQDERQAFPLAIEDAAVRLVSQISEGW